MYEIDIDGRSIYVMGDGFSLTPTHYWDGSQWNNFDDEESEEGVIWTQDRCHICVGELDPDYQPTMFEIVSSIFNKFEDFDYINCEITDYNRNGDVIYGDNGDEDWERTMSGGEEAAGECYNELFSGQDSDSDSEY
jgi:hypothetical protein